MTYKLFQMEIFIEQSAPGRVNNSDLLQEAEKQISEEKNYDAGVTADASKINEGDGNMII